MTRQEWQDAEKKLDPNFEGSLSQKIGCDKELCPSCNQHLKGGICLNACHLGDDGARAFADTMKRFMETRKSGAGA